MRGGWYDQKQNEMTIIETLLVSSIPAGLTILYTHFRFRNEMEKHRSEMMSERAAKHFLSNEKFKARTFRTLKRHLGGWDNDEDELRRILVRAGAIRTYRTETDGTKTELWQLMGRKWAPKHANDD